MTSGTFYKKKVLFRLMIMIPFFGIMFTCGGVVKLKESMNPRQDFNTVPMSKINDDKYYEGQISNCLYCYATNEIDGNTVYYYLASRGNIDNEQYITIAATSRKHVKVLEMMSTEDVSGTTQLLWKCRADRMSNNLRRRINEVLAERGLYDDADEVGKHVAPYLLYYDNGNLIEAGVMLYLGLCFLSLTILGVYLFIRKKQSISDEE